MALIKCPECNKEISDKASICPNCGMSIIELNYSVPTMVKVASFIFPVVGFIIYGINVSKNDKLAKEGLKFALIGMCTAFVIVCCVLLLNFLLTPVDKTVYGNRNTSSVSSDIIQSEEIVVHEYRGSNYEEAKKELEENGVVVKIEYKKNDFYKKNIVIEQIPSAGSSISKGDTITLVVSLES